LRGREFVRVQLALKDSTAPVRVIECPHTALVAEVPSTLTIDVIAGRVKLDVAAADRTDLVFRTAILAVQEFLVLLLSGLDLFLAAVVRGACLGIFVVDGFLTGLAGGLLAGGAFIDSFEGVGRIRVTVSAMKVPHAQYTRR
jgi:hypothetical protein